jgi:putative transposase
MKKAWGVTTNPVSARERSAHPMPHRYADRIAQALSEIKGEEEVWGEITAAMQMKIKDLLEGVLEAERDRLVACEWYKRGDLRRDQRSGYRTRSLVTSLGRISKLRVPRMRTAHFHTMLWHHYRRRASPVDRAVIESFLCGVATRKVKRTLRSILGEGSPSHQAVSRLVSRLNEGLIKWQTAPITDDIEILYVDGVYLRIKDRGVRKRPTLFALGITKQGKVRVLGFWHAWEESADEVQAFLQSLHDRELRGSNLKAVVADQAPAVFGAVTTLWPYAKFQLCVFHKMKNLVFALKRCPLKGLIIKDARAIFTATSRAEALRRARLLHSKWVRLHPKPIKNFLHNIDLCLTYFDLPDHLWKKARTTNPIDRFFTEIRRRTNTMGAFLDRNSASRILFALSDMENQNRLRKEKNTPRATSAKINSAHL